MVRAIAIQAKGHEVARDIRIPELDNAEEFAMHVGAFHIQSSETLLHSCSEVPECGVVSSGHCRSSCRLSGVGAEPGSESEEFVRRGQIYRTTCSKGTSGHFNPRASNARPSIEMVFK